MSNSAAYQSYTESREILFSSPLPLPLSCLTEPCCDACLFHFGFQPSPTGAILTLNSSVLGLYTYAFEYFQMECLDFSHSWLVVKWCSHACVTERKIH
jgi:hypothetical protein